MLRGVQWAFLGLGSNIEDRLGYIQDAVNAINVHPKIRVDAVSSVYETEPVGGPEQDPYLNLVARVATLLSPRKLLAATQQVEHDLGRVRAERWGPRTIDVDILLYGDRVVKRRHIQIPHPRLDQRPFALVPLMEVAPGHRLPDGRSIASILARLAPVTGIAMVGAQVTSPSSADG